MNWLKQGFVFVVSSSLVLATTQAGRADEVEQSMAQTGQQSPEKLDQVVAPIALYPDALVAQILTASTHPGEVVEAERWLQQYSDLDTEALADLVDLQGWDPSVKALTQFPLILANLDRNLSWTRALGDAYESEPQNVLNAVQVMRQRAQQAGTLLSTPQETVTTEAQTITIEPTGADTVYLPEYDPWLVYGAQVPAYPGWSAEPGLFVTEPEVLFGLGVGIGAFAGFDWGYHHWGADWHGRNHQPDITGSQGFARTFAFHAGPSFGAGFRATAGSFPGRGGFHGGGHR
jgi:Protein of unknown function (DUF3300)